MPDFVQSADGTSIAYDVAGGGPALVVTGGAFNTLPYSVDRETEDLEAAIKGAAMSRIAVYEPPYVPGNVAAMAGVQTALDAGDPALAALRFVEGTGAENTDGLTGSPWCPSMVAIANTLPYDLALSGDDDIPTDLLASIHVPLLVVDGGASPAWAANAAAAIASAVPSGRRVTVAGEDHNVSPASLAQILIEFLESSSWSMAMHIRGRVFRALVAAAAVATLAGCSSLAGSTGSGLGAAGGAVIAQEALTPQSPSPSASPSGSAAVGRCWQLTYAQYLVQPENVGGRVVPCSSAHQAYTYAVVKLDADLQRSLAQPPAFSACQVPYGHIFPQSLGEGRVFLSELLPSAADWATGSRTVACTVQTFTIGSSFISPTLLDLPTFSDFVTAVNSSVVQYSLCVNDPGTDGDTGPSLGSAATIADCSTGQWLLEPSPGFPDPAGETYPGYNGLYPFMHAHCGALYDTATRRGWIFFPSADQWASGDRTFQCWTGAR